jgi:hypothetical protein
MVCPPQHHLGELQKGRWIKRHPRADNRGVLRIGVHQAVAAALLPVGCPIGRVTDEGGHPAQVGDDAVAVPQ